jgi:hypothetical protein
LYRGRNLFPTGCRKMKIDRRRNHRWQRDFTLEIFLSRLLNLN